VYSFSDTVINLQQQINYIEDYCKSVKMKINLSKTKIIVFRNGGVLKQTEKWLFNNEPIEVVPFYKYLGVFFTPKLVWSKTQEMRNFCDLPFLRVSVVEIGQENNLHYNSICKEYLESYAMIKNQSTVFYRKYFLFATLNEIYFADRTRCY
jgi:hypothetical protein